MHEPVITRPKAETAILIGVIDNSNDEQLVHEYLDELALLAWTAGAIPMGKFVQKLEYPNPRTFVGAGKLQEIRDFVDKEKIDLVIFDDELTASQIRNIERELNCRILDRTNLILEYQYLLPRLAGMWTHLERQRGGIGLRGPGETEIETDRRVIRDRIAKLKDDLIKIDKQKKTQRQNRGKMVRVALVGYTNVGKSTLMNVLSKSDIFAEDKLFATLDTTVRKIVIHNLPFLISDTVGFIRKLPHSLVESFKSTLDEVRESDILLHVVDISHPNFEEQVEIVQQTLYEIDANDKQVILVFNKIDAFKYVLKEYDDLTPLTQENLSLDDLKRTWMARCNGTCVFISSKNKENINDIKDLLYAKVKEIHVQRYPYDDLLY